MTVPPASPVRSEQGSGLPEHAAGALAYVLGPITGVVFLMIDRDRPFVRFHALQSIGLTVVWISIWIALTIMGTALAVVPIVGWLIDVLLGLAISLAGFALWLWIMFKAWGGHRWEIPLVGRHVRRIADNMASSPDRIA